MTSEAYVLPTQLPWSTFAGPLERAEDAVARLDEATLLCLGVPVAGQPAPGTAAPRAILLEFATSKVLFEKDAGQLTAPASVAKLVTVEVLLDRMRKGQAGLDDGAHAN